MATQGETKCPAQQHIKQLVFNSLQMRFTRLQTQPN